MELFAVALLLPVLAGLGFVSMGRELAGRQLSSEQPAPSTAQQSSLVGTREAAVARVLTTLRFFWNSAQGEAPDASGHKGFYYHLPPVRTAW